MKQFAAKSSLGVAGSDLATVYNIPEAILEELLAECDDVEMLEEMIDIRSELIPEDQKGQRRKSKLLTVDPQNTKKIQHIIASKKKKILYKRAIEAEKKAYWEN